jgi:hypothetical protein
MGEGKIETYLDPMDHKVMLILFKVALELVLLFCVAHGVGYASVHARIKPQQKMLGNDWEVGGRRRCLFARWGGPEFPNHLF